MAPKQEAEKVTITLDGKSVEASKGEMIIAAAERAGVYIPRFCYHPRMKPVGMCRMCLVEVVGPRGPALTPACFVAVADGQVVNTTTPAVKKAQDGVLEFLLVNHPLDCPVCDKGGECPLQDQTLTFGPGESRFVEEKRHWEKPIALSELVLLDRERCIQCARCTRFAAEVAGDPQIDFAARGDEVEVAIFPGEPFTSYFSGNTVQICPVGALTSSPYRFKARPWDLEQVESSCTSCAVGCRVAVQSSGDQVTRYLGVDSDPVNQSWLCDKGRFDWEAVSSAERVTAPMVRKGDELVEVGWAEALEAVAAGLKKAREVHGGAALGMIGGARLPNEDAYAWSKLARAVLGTDNVDAQLGDGLPAAAVLGLPRATIDQACQADAVILLGADIKEELPVLYLRLRGAAVDAQLPIIELAEQRSGLSRYAAATLCYRPGEAHTLVRALLAGDEPTADVAGVPAAEIAQARARLKSIGEKGAGAAEYVVVLGRPSVASSGAGVAEAASVIAGGLPGVRFLSALRRGNVHGALDMGLAPGVLPGRVSLNAGRDWFTQAWGALPEAAGMDTTAMLSEAAEGRLAGLILLGADPISDFPDRTLAKKGLQGAGFVVAVDCFLTESSRKADVVLPAATYAERPGTFTNQEGRVLRLGQKVTAPGVAWPDWMIASELAYRIGGDLGFDNLDGIWDEIERLSPTHAGVTTTLLASGRAKDGVVVPLGLAPLPEIHPLDPMAEPGIIAAETNWLAAGVPAEAGFPPGAAAGPENVPGEVDRGPEGDVGGTDPLLGGVGGPAVAGNEPVELAEHTPGTPAAEPAVPGPEGATAPAGAPGADWVPGDHESPGEPVTPPPATKPQAMRFDSPTAATPVPPPDAYSLRLIAPRRLWDAGVGVAHSPHLAGLAPTPQARAHPADLERLGHASGARVKAISARGSLLLEVVADAGVPRGSVAIGFNLPGDSAGDLIDATAAVTNVRLDSV
ncbi:MAG TPA: NADH-quinone oxidoreductase subunit NuoG [Acidimicrobiales bacterium]|nr:NADH-quinone oxidoreductase subunit NuoG [Acidimicrobiales bacterium]